MKILETKNGFKSLWELAFNFKIINNNKNKKKILQLGLYLTEVMSFTTSLVIAPVSMSSCVLGN